MMRNEAYVTHSQKIKCSHSLQLDLNVSRDEAYDTSENVMLNIKQPQLMTTVAESESPTRVKSIANM